MRTALRGGQDKKSPEPALAGSGLLVLIARAPHRGARAFSGQSFTGTLGSVAPMLWGTKPYSSLRKTSSVSSSSLAL